MCQICILWGLVQDLSFSLSLSLPPPPPYFICYRLMQILSIPEVFCDITIALSLFRLMPGLSTSSIRWMRIGFSHNTIECAYSEPVQLVHLTSDRAEFCKHSRVCSSVWFSKVVNVLETVLLYVKNIGSIAYLVNWSHMLWNSTVYHVVSDANPHPSDQWRFLPTFSNIWNSSI